MSAKTKKLNEMRRKLGYEMRSFNLSLKKFSKTNMDKKSQKILERIDRLREYYRTGYLKDMLDHAEQIRSNMFFRFQATKPEISQQTGRLEGAILDPNFVKIIARGTRAQENLAFVGIANVRTLDQATILEKGLYRRIYGLKTLKASRSKIYSSSIMKGERIVGHWEFQEAGPVRRDYILARRKNVLHSEDREIVKNLERTLIANSKRAFLRGSVSGGKI